MENEVENSIVSVRIFNWYSMSRAIIKCKDSILKEQKKMLGKYGDLKRQYVGKSRLLSTTKDEITYEVWVEPKEKPI